MIGDIKTAAESVGITAVITNSTEKIEVQLNRLTGQEDLPLMLVSWDLDLTLQINENGFLDNPKAKVVCLLMNKPEDTAKETHEDMSVEMFYLYSQFIQSLNSILSTKQVNHANYPVQDIGAKLVPKHGLGKHSGVMGRFTMSISVTNC